MVKMLKNSDSNTLANEADLTIAMTDPNGIIVSVNNNFEKISEYSLAEIKNKAFSFLIHQDMPKALVKMIWKQLNNKQPTVIYIKQKSKSGKVYWSCTSIFQIKNGFLILGIKANTVSLRKIKKIYSEILLEESQTVSDSENNLYKKFEELIATTFGVTNYQEFISVAFEQEIKARHLLIPKENANSSSVMLLAERILKIFLSITNSLKNLSEDNNILDESISYCSKFDYSKVSEINSKNIKEFTDHLKNFSEHILQHKQETESQLNEVFKCLQHLIFQTNIMILQIEALEFYKLHKRRTKENEAIGYLEPSFAEKITFLEKLIEKNISNIKNQMETLFVNIENLKKLTESYLYEIENLEKFYNQAFNLNQKTTTVILPAIKAINVKLVLAKEALLNILNESKIIHECASKTFEGYKSFDEDLFKQERKAKNAFERF